MIRWILEATMSLEVFQSVLIRKLEEKIFLELIPSTVNLWFQRNLYEWRMQRWF